MYTFRFLIVVLAGIGLLVLPSMAQAQPDVCGFYGTVILNGEPAPDGTPVKAWIDGTEVGRTTTTDSAYVLFVDGINQLFAGKTILFSAGPHDPLQYHPYYAAESAVFESGANTSLNLNVLVGKAPPGEPVRMNLIPPQGLATNLCGEDFTDSSPINIYFDGNLYITVEADSSGGFCVPVIPSTSEPGTYAIKAIDRLGKGFEATFVLINTVGEPGPQGEQGPQGQEGAPGDMGPPGTDGKDANSLVGIIAIIAAITALVVVIALAFRLKGKARTQAS